MMGHFYHLSRRASYLLLWGGLLIAFYFFFTLPAHPQWHGNLGFLFQNPLGMALDFILLVTMGLYILHHAFVPDAPKYRSWFVGGAFVAGMIAAGVYDRALASTPDYFAASGGAQFVSVAVISYCLYRLCECLPPKTRQYAAAAAAVVLSLFLMNEGVVAANVLQHCTPQNAFSVWGEVFANCA